jgi:hypothetical protein
LLKILNNGNFPLLGALGCEVTGDTDRRRFLPLDTSFADVPDSDIDPVVSALGVLADTDIDRSAV